VSNGTMKLIQGQGQGTAELLPDDDLWDVERAARFLGMSTHWVYRAAERGDLPYRKIGSRLRFLPGELRTWAQGR
jgi:predicted DNA-binding transcriptional regulator AlpA